MGAIHVVDNCHHCFKLAYAAFAMEHVLVQKIRVDLQKVLQLARTIARIVGNKELNPGNVVLSQGENPVGI